MRFRWQLSCLHPNYSNRCCGRSRPAGRGQPSRRCCCNVGPPSRNGRSIKCSDHPCSRRTGCRPAVRSRSSSPRTCGRIDDIIAEVTVFLSFTGIREGVRGRRREHSRRGGHSSSREPPRRLLRTAPRTRRGLPNPFHPRAIRGTVRRLHAVRESAASRLRRLRERRTRTPRGAAEAGDAGQGSALRFRRVAHHHRRTVGLVDLGSITGDRLERHASTRRRHGCHRSVPVAIAMRVSMSSSAVVCHLSVLRRPLNSRPAAPCAPVRRMAA